MGLEPVVQALLGRLIPEAAEAIFGLPRAAQSIMKRTLFADLVPEAVRGGISASRLLSMFRESGIGIRAQDAYRIYRTERTQDYIRNLAPDQPIDLSMAHFEAIQMDSDYYAKVKITYVSRSTGELKERWVTSDVAEGITKGELEDVWADYIEASKGEDPYKDILEVEKVEIVDLIGRRGR